MGYVTDETWRKQPKAPLNSQKMIVINLKQFLNFDDSTAHVVGREQGQTNVHEIVAAESFPLERETALFTGHKHNFLNLIKCIRVETLQLHRLQ